MDQLRSVLHEERPSGGGQETSSAEPEELTEEKA